MQNQDMSLVLSTDAKPRLKWTPELHHRFVEAVAHLGGPDKATPKTLMRVMGVPGLTLLGKSQQAETFSDNNQEDYCENQNREIHFDRETGDGTQNPINESLQIAQALQVQLEVQRKLHEHIEVQRHLQLRIEAQGKGGTGKAELTQLVSIFDTGCPSSSFSELTETGGSGLKDKERKPMRGTGCSLESSLTSSESSGRKEEKQRKNENGNTNKCTSMAPTLMEIHPEDSQAWKSGSSNQASGRKRNGSTISDGNCVEQPSGKRSPTYAGKTGDRLRKLGLLETLDLNTQYQIDIDSAPKAIDLNCKE
ncbi:Myb family transcription factor PHL8 [Vitis vinifera]|uniref:Myb family transcription factor PHL8 n=1 Tax=Vitis vinifera TaxID=29760 RepID=A0A438G4T9_VITVI|nr:Myb family transcription factor PHL8 [Vitis vinifera]